ncbi:MAG: thiamine-phosphate kinase [Proteobacteria bacterium]|nr:thiamine-phosphate kinase [Pseudomonadota bacterium]
MNEFECIEKYFAPLSAAAEGALGLKDDAFIMSPKAGHQVVVSKDIISENIHFTFDLDSHSGEKIEPAYVARKLLRGNLSDMAAMGAKPKYYLLGVLWNHTVNEAWIESFVSGLAEDQKHFGVTLVGGDTVKREDGRISLSMTVIGEVKKDHALKRSGAKVGDKIYVTGTIGDGALGLLAFRGAVKGLTREQRDFLVERYHLPEPRHEVMAKLAEAGVVSAAIDVSDGLMADIDHVLAASKVGATIDRSAIPLSHAAADSLKHDTKLWDVVLSGGDDYEVAFTVPADKAKEMEALAKEQGTPVTCIGKITAGKELEVLDAEGKPYSPDRRGYRHF